MPSEPMPIQVILVPAGAEYQAVNRGARRGLKENRGRGNRGKGNRGLNGPTVMAIPAGPQALQQFLVKADLGQGQGILLMGLGGSLSPCHAIGDGVLLQGVWQRANGGGSSHLDCDRALTDWLQRRLATVKVGTGVSCDRVVTTAAQKKQLRDRDGADVVDMEGATLLRTLPHAQIAMVRVISDDCYHDLPNIADAINAHGGVKPTVLLLAFLRRPWAALRLIRGALKGLNALEDLTALLCRY